MEKECLSMLDQCWPGMILHIWGHFAKSINIFCCHLVHEDQIKCHTPRLPPHGLLAQLQGMKHLKEMTRVGWLWDTQLSREEGAGPPTFEDTSTAEQTLSAD